jgi:hypothetical protein
MIRILALALTASLAAGTALAQLCPANYQGRGLTTPSGTPIMAAASRDSSCTTFCAWHSSWDHALGTAHAEAQDVGCFTEISSTTDFGQYTSDDYVLTGPAGPNPVSFEVLLNVSGSASDGCHTFCDPFLGCETTCTPGSVQASLSDGTQTSSAAPAASIHTSLQLHLSRPVGEHFHLDRSLFVHAFCGSNSSISSALQIVLPPGYGVTSCYGYAGAGPVTAMRTSWGKVKLLYR